ncbi:MAG TPA: hypothetical protein VF266_25210, partial [Thermoanaerobaculia bacterium]
GEGFETPSLSDLNAQWPKTAIAKSATAKIVVLLTAREVVGRYRMTAVLRWVSADGSGHVATVHVGPVRVHRGWKAKALGFGVPILSLYKDLALPVVVLLTGFLFQQWLARLEENRRRTEQERSHVQTTWTQMLPTSHQNTSAYYLPTIRAAGRAVTKYGEWKKSGDLTARDQPASECLYYTVLFVREMKEIREKIGGAFLKSHHVEKLLAALWKFANNELERVLGFEDLSTVLMRMKRHEAYPSFMQRLRTSKHDSSAHRVAARFGAWLSTGFEDLVVPLKLFITIFTYELNWPYLYWYERLDLEYPENDIVALRHDLADLIAEKAAAYEAATQRVDGASHAEILKRQCSELQTAADLLRAYMVLAKKKATEHRYVAVAANSPEEES